MPLSIARLTRSPFIVPSSIDLDLTPFLPTLQEKTTTIQLTCGQRFLEEGHIAGHLYLLTEGILADVITNLNGLEKWTLTFPPYPIAFSAAIHTQPLLYRSVPLTDCTLLAFSVDHFLACLSEDPALLRAILYYTAMETRLSNHSLYVQHCENTPQKIAQVLYFYHILRKDAPLDRLRFTQQLIANLAGVHRTSVTAMIQRLRRQEILGDRPTTPLSDAQLRALEKIAFSDLCPD